MSVNLFCAREVSYFHTLTVGCQIEPERKNLTSLCLLSFASLCFQMFGNLSDYMQMNRLCKSMLFKMVVHKCNFLLQFLLKMNINFIATKACSSDNSAYKSIIHHLYIFLTSGSIAELLKCLNNNNNNKQFSIPLRQIFTSKKWLHQSGSGILSVNKINTSSGLADTNKDRKHAKHQNIKTPDVQIYTKERKQYIKVNIYKLKLQ